MLNSLKFSGGPLVRYYQSYRPDRAFLIFCGVFSVVLLWHHGIVNDGEMLHHDMIEAAVWGDAWQWGYYKHPPVSAWIPGIWFTFFPSVNISYHFLTIVSLMTTLFFTFKVASRFVGPARSMLAALSLLVVPIYLLQSAIYNANTAQLPFFPLVVLFYLRFISGRAVLDAIIFGLLVGLLVQVKYYAALLPLSLILHSVIDKQTRALWNTKLPVIAIGAAIVVAIPHLLWLIQNDWQPISYAFGKGGSEQSQMWSKWRAFTFGLPAFFIIAFGALTIIQIRSKLENINVVENARALAASSDGKALLCAAFGPFLATLVLSILLGVVIDPLWGVALGFAWPIIFVKLLPLPDGLKSITDLGRLMVVTAFILALSAPLVRYVFPRNVEDATPIHLLIDQIRNEWAEHAPNQKSYFVAGSTRLANALQFYAPGFGKSLQGTGLQFSPWISQTDLENSGIIYVCKVRDQACVVDVATFPTQLKHIANFELPSREKPDELLGFKLYFALP